MQYKDYKTSFEMIKKHSKKLYFSDLIKAYKTNIKKTWKFVKEALGKGQVNSTVYPKKIAVKEKNITKNESIAINFINFFY